MSSNALVLSVINSRRVLTVSVKLGGMGQQVESEALLLFPYGRQSTFQNPQVQARSPTKRNSETPPLTRRKKTPNPQP